MLSASTPTEKMDVASGWQAVETLSAASCFWLSHSFWGFVAYWAYEGTGSR